MTFDEFIEEWRGESSYIGVRTSGSTGEPKWIRLSKSFVRRSAERTNRFFSINPGCRLHSCVSPDFIGGKMMAVRADIAGCRLTYEPPSNRILRNADDNRPIDLLAVVPSQMLDLLDNLDQIPEIRAIIIGGSPIMSDLRKRISESGLNAYETYGMTETSSHIALRKVTEKIGWFETFPGITVSSDNRSCLVIDFESGERIATNDIAETDGKRKFRITGRWDHVIITGGKKVNPYSVESKISGIFHSGIMITSEPDEKWGERVVLRIEGEKDLEEKILLRKLKEVLAKWEVPKKIEWVKSLPRTENGKLIRQTGKNNGNKKPDSGDY